MPITEYLPGDFAQHIKTPASKEEANRYCEELAKTHYENFTVASLFLPKDKRQHFYNIYSYCRWSDDLADEVPDPIKALELLNWWENELEKCYAGKPEHPVFVALQDTITAFDIPITPFRNLLIAFKQDQTVTRYPTYQDLVGYCVNSANPVGHLVLYLCGYRDKQRQDLADFTCTALQLTNFWQDIALDLQKGRIYLPLEDMAKFQYSEADLFSHKYSEAFIQLMQFEVQRTYELFKKGLELCSLVNRKVRLDVELFSRGGMELLNRIEDNQYDVFTRRPVLSKKDKLRLMFQRALGI